MMIVLDGSIEIVTEVWSKTQASGIALSDPHVGSESGHLHSGAKRTNGEIIAQSSHQKLMEKGLLSNLRKEGKKDFLMLLGDLFEGRPDKGIGAGNVDNRISHQTVLAFEALKPIVNIVQPKIIIGIDGTENHGGADMRVSESLALEYPDIKVYHGVPNAFVQVGKLSWKLKHKGSTSGTALLSALEGNFTQRAKDATIQGYEVGDVFLYGHSHACVIGILSDGPKMIMCPGLKMNDTFLSGQSRPRQPDLGFISWEQDGKDLNAKYVRVYNPNLI